MYGQNIQHVEPIILLLLVCIVVLTALAKQFKTPYPIVLVVAGLFHFLRHNLVDFVMKPKSHQFLATITKSG